MLGLMAIAVSIAVQSGAAQAQDEPGSPEITVEGVRNPDRQVGAFVDALTDAPIKGQLSRFDWAVCPAAVGLSPADNMAIVERMRRVAEAAGIKRAAADCRPNALVIVTRDKSELIERLHKQHPAYFTGMADGDVRRLARGRGSAAAWHVEGLLDRDGKEVPRDQIGGNYVVDVTDSPSRITPGTRPHFAASVLVVELRALSGLTITQLADYAAMRTFARTDPARLENSAAPTILTVLDAPMDSAIPITLTDWDLGFLKALYSSNENRYAGQQRNEIRSRLKDDLRGRKAEEE